MQEFINSVVNQLGVNEETAQSATGKALKLLKDHGGDATTKLLSALPGAEGLIGAADSGSGGGLGASLGGLGSALTGKLGGTAGALAALQGSGLDAGKMGSFVKMLVDYAKQKAGVELVDQVLEKVPDVKGMIDQT